MPHYRIVTLGCKLNQAESSDLEARLRALGLTRAGGEAEVVVLNTCTVTGNADREARQIARRLRRENPRATIIATGCYAERDPGALGALPGIDHVVGLSEQATRVPALAAEALGLPAPAVRDHLGVFGATTGCDPGPDPGDRTRAYLKIQDGCNLRCSYCIIPSVRGSSRSLPSDVVLARIARLVEAGFQEIVFTGVNTGDYGKDLDRPLGLSHLLEQAVRVPGLGRIRLNSLEPRTVTGDLIACLTSSSGRVAPHLQIPLQSGSDAVLARMRRPYRLRDYARVVEALRRAIPAIGLGADVIVGFPGETALDFESTFRFIESSPLNYLHVFSYSARPGTSAASLPDRVPPDVVRERSASLRALGADLSFRFRRSFVGRELSVLALREIRPDGRLRGLSDNFIDLGLDLGGCDAARWMNRLLSVRITDVTEHETLAAIA
jgi:threonylcarbamoyladenosine tRNA methylthiotransferase MtaB